MAGSICPRCNSKDLIQHHATVVCLSCDLVARPGDYSLLWDESVRSQSVFGAKYANPKKELRNKFLLEELTKPYS
jgi:Zn ribbon nucleic-acid-binding protein